MHAYITVRINQKNGFGLSSSAIPGTGSFTGLEPTPANVAALVFRVLARGVIVRGAIPNPPPPLPPPGVTGVPTPAVFAKNGFVETPPPAPVLLGLLGIAPATKGFGCALSTPDWPTLTALLPVAAVAAVADTATAAMPCVAGAGPGGEAKLLVPILAENSGWQGRAEHKAAVGRCERSICSQMAVTSAT